MKVNLMLTCLCDAFYGEVGIATVQVLERAGCDVSFPPGQTCCGQPPFNAGDWKAARSIAKHAMSTFGLDESGHAPAPIVTPSSSCAAMLREGYGMLFEGFGHPPVYELAEFLLGPMGVTGLEGFRSAEGAKLASPDTARGSSHTPQPGKRRVAFHRACHSRMLGLGDVQERLVSMVSGVELVPIEQPEQCCGFGGAFSITHGSISSGIGSEKLKHVIDSGVDTLLSGDMGCLMHLNGLIERERLPLKSMHYVQLLAEALPE